MAVTIFIPTPLRPYAGNQEECQIQQEGTVSEIMQALVAEHSALKAHLYDADGNLRKFVNIYVNDTDIRDQEQENTTVKDGDSISIIPAIAGGLDV